MNNPVLILDAIGKTYHQAGQGLDVLKGVSLSVAAGQMVALVGHSGSGKTTLLQIAGLLDAPSAGSVQLMGQDTANLSDKKRTLLRNQQIGFVYQFHHLLPEFSALENVMMPQLLARISKKSARAKAEALIESVGLKDRMTHRPAELSGGEQQRIAIARALVNGPSLLLADEPTGNLDDANASAVFDLLMNLARHHGMAALIATHNRELAARMDMKIGLKNGILTHD